MSVGLDNLKHIVVLMMGGRSFDHMLGALAQKYPKINGLTGGESNPDTTGALVKVQPNAEFQSQLDPMPDHHFTGVDLQIFGGAPPSTKRVANMQGFVKDYFAQTRDVRRSHNVMQYFAPDKLPVLTTLATEFALFNGWFSSVPGPTVCNRTFAHYGTSFGQIGMDLSYIPDTDIQSIYERLIRQGRTSKLYYYDSSSSVFAPAQLITDRLGVAVTYTQFIADCASGSLPDYSFIEPCHNDHTGPSGGMILASDQHPDHNVGEGERFIAHTYNAIRTNPSLWQSTAFLIVYDHHGGIYDHVAPPTCTPDGYMASPQKTGTGESFAFDRLGVRVPAVLVSPWIPRGTIVPGTESPDPQIFEHASIPCTVTNFFLAGDAKRTIREQKANTFLGVLTDRLRPDDDCVVFRNLAGPLPPAIFNPNRPASETLLAQVGQLREAEQKLTASEQSGIDTRSIKTEGQAADYIRAVTTKLQERSGSPKNERIIAGFHSDVAAGEDLLGITPEVESLCAILAARDVEPPISIGLFGDWGTGKTFFMQQMERELNFIGRNAQLANSKTVYCSNIVQLWFNAWHYVDANLWASLVSHIFEGLAEYVSPSANDQQARALLLSKLQTAKDIRAEAERERERALLQKQETENALKQLAEKRAQTEAKLANLRLPDLQRLLETDPELKKELEQTLSSLGYPTAMKSLTNLEATLKDAYTLGGRLRTALVFLWQSKQHTTQIFLLALVLIGFPTMTWMLRIWLPNQWLFTSVGTAWGELSVIAISVTATLRKYLGLGSKYLSRFEAAQQKVGDLLEAKKQEKSGKELDLEKELHEIKAKEVGTSKQFSDAQAKVRDIEAKIKEIDEGRNLSKFLLERVHADDYRKYLGIISSIRRDFEMLNKIWSRGEGSPAHALPQIDRIILYVDDLDRCPERTVVEVLQAIHLLLFFPLFVVVVGVDSRWLLHSLRQQSRALQDNDKIDEDLSDLERAHWQSTPLNYLEKIFQIPYSVRPMEEPGFQHLVNTLTQHKDSSEKNREGGPDQSTRLTQEQASRALVSPGPSPSSSASTDATEVSAASTTKEAATIERTVVMRPFDPNPKRLKLEECERSFIRRLYSLIPSPRAAKRFVNVYRLLRSSISDAGLGEFVTEDGTGEYQSVQLLLAIQTGYPEQAAQIIHDLVARPPNKEWWDFIKSYEIESASPKNASKGKKRRDGGDNETNRPTLAERESWGALARRLAPLSKDILVGKSCDDFIKWAPMIARYSFRSMRLL